MKNLVVADLGLTALAIERALTIMLGCSCAKPCASMTSTGRLFQVTCVECGRQLQRNDNGTADSWRIVHKGIPSREVPE